MSLTFPPNVQINGTVNIVLNKRHRLVFSLEILQGNKDAVLQPCFSTQTALYRLWS